VVARWQLEPIGVTRSMLKTRIARGSLTRLHRGVYAVGHQQLRPQAHTLAAVLAVGRGAAASHRDAAWLHGLRPGGHARCDVTTTRRGAASTATITVHRTTVLPPEHLTTVDRIPTTTVARTLVDLAAVVAPDHLAKAVSEAERLRRFDLRALHDAMARTEHRNGPGHARLRAVLADLATHGTDDDHSKLERRFATLARQAGLPRPRQNHWVDGLEVDAVWPDHRIAVELDSWEFHRHRRAFQRDREKANALVAAGWTVLRYTHRDLTTRPEQVAEQLRELLRANERDRYSPTASR